MKRAKRILSLLLSLCLVLGLFPNTAFAASGNLPFTDVNTSDWYYDAVQYAYEKGMMNGTSTTTFSPNETTTRGMIVTILHRMEGTPAAVGTTFTDIPTGQWYSDAVSWASANGIVGGYGNGLFGPSDPITREQMAAILNRYSQHKGYDTGASGSIAGFSDASQVSSYAVDPMGWAVGNGLISGVGNNTLAPKGNATRAQVATILMRFCENIVDKANSTSTPATTVEKTYTVTFDLNYGSDTRYDVKTVKEGETVSKPSNPSRGGYSFSGWYAEKSGGKQFDFKTGITSDLTLYAHWSSNSSSSGGGSHSSGSSTPSPSPMNYTVSFESNGGTAVASQTVTSGGCAVEPDAPERTGYIFTGWFKDASLTTVFSFSQTITSNITLYAGWMGEADYFYSSVGEIVKTIDASTSNNILTEQEAKLLMEECGFTQYPVTYDHTIDGEYLDDTEVVNESTAKHPTYQTYHVATDGTVWSVYIVNAEVFAYPVTFNVNATSVVDYQLVVTKTDTITSYVGNINKFYVTLPASTAVFKIPVDSIDATTLNSLTLTSLCELTGIELPIEDYTPTYSEDEIPSDYDLADVETFTEDLNGSTRVSSNGTAVIVALGDSYSAGEGIPPFIGQQNSQGRNLSIFDKTKSQDWLAHRSTKGWPTLLTVPGKEVKLYFNAASGAETKHFAGKFNKTFNKSYHISLATTKLYHRGSVDLPAQQDIFNGIGEQVDYVTMTLGGNDADFVGVITKCVTESSYIKGLFVDTTGLEEKLYNTLDTAGNIIGNLKSIYREIHNRAPHAKIIIAGYPELLNKDGKGITFSKREASYVNWAVRQFNVLIEQATIDCNQDEGIPIYFVDVVEAFDGHQAFCNNEWINELMLLKSEDRDDLALPPVSAYSMHPNENGARAYARCVNAKIRELEAQENNNKTISGVITIADTDTDMTNNLPLEGAQITLTKLDTIPSLGIIIPSLVSAKSGSDGRYTINNLASGTYGIMITKEGYISVSGTVTIADDVENYYNAAIEAISQDYAGDGTASGTVYDVLTGRSVPGLTLNIRSGINVTDGTIVATISTGTDGKYTTPHLPAGNYSVEIVDNRTLTDDASRYLTSTFTIKILGAHMISNQDGFVTNGLQADQLRIVLKWGESPRDLDSHLVGPAGDSGKFHVYYSNKNYRANSKLMANLDLDDTSSYGPETTTIYEMTPGVYMFMVHDYTNRSRSFSTALSASGAYVEVYMGSSTTAAYTFHVPGGDGTLWTVFSYDSNTGTILPINTMSYQRSASSVGSNYQVRDTAVFSDELDYDLEPVEDPLKDYEIAELQNSVEDNTPQGNQPEPVGADNSEVEDTPSSGQQEPGTVDTAETENTSQESTNNNLSETGNVPEVTIVGMPANETTIETDAQTR